MRELEDDPSQDRRGTWDGSKVVIAFVALLLLLVLSIVLISVRSGGHDMENMHGVHTGPRTEKLTLV